MEKISLNLLKLRCLSFEYHAKRNEAAGQNYRQKTDHVDNANNVFSIIHRFDLSGFE